MCGGSWTLLQAFCLAVRMEVALGALLTLPLSSQALSDENAWSMPTVT